MDIENLGRRLKGSKRTKKGEDVAVRKRPAVTFIRGKGSRNSSASFFLWLVGKAMASRLRLLEPPALESNNQVPFAHEGSLVGQDCAAAKSDIIKERTEGKKKGTRIQG